MGVALKVMVGHFLCEVVNSAMKFRTVRQYSCPSRSTPDSQAFLQVHDDTYPADSVALQVFDHLWHHETFPAHKPTDTAAYNRVPFPYVSNLKTISIQKPIKSIFNFKFSFLFQILLKIGISVYEALDFNLPQDEECMISQNLHDLISLMTYEGKLVLFHPPNGRFH